MGLSCQWECISEVRTIISDLEDGIACADKISISGDNSMVISRCTADGTDLRDQYFFTKRLDGGILYYNGQPISALDKQHHIRLQELSFKALSPYSVKVHIMVVNGVTGRNITVDTVMFSHCQWRKMNEKQLDGVSE